MVHGGMLAQKSDLDFYGIPNGEEIEKYMAEKQKAALVSSLRSLHTYRPPDKVATPLY